MKFVEFQSLVNENPKSIMPILRDPRAVDAECTVTEKLHGTNFGIWWNQKAQEIKFSKRTSFIGEESNFFNWQQFFDEERVAGLVEKFKELNHNFTEMNITIYGELFGGGPDYKCKPVQREIDYGCPITFKAYQVVISNDEGDHVYYCPHHQRCAVLETLGLDHVPLIVQGKLLKLYSELNPDNFKSTIAKDAIAEGYVFEVANEDGSKPLIIKKRSTNFLENKGVSSKTFAIDPNLAAEVVTVIKIFESMCTPQRVSNVNSHFGYDELKQFPLLIKAVSEDIMEDFRKENGDVSEDAIKHAKRSIGRVLPPMIREELTKE